MPRIEAVCGGARSKSKSVPMVKGFSRLQVAADRAKGELPLPLTPLSYGLA